MKIMLVATYVHLFLPFCTAAAIHSVSRVDLVLREAWSVSPRADIPHLGDLQKRRGGGGDGGSGSGSGSAGGDSGSSGSSGSSGASGGSSNSGSSSSSGSGSGSGSDGEGDGSSSSNSGGGSGGRSPPNTSPSSNTGGESHSGSGTPPSYGGGTYYAGGSRTPFPAGSQTPGGLTPQLLPNGAGRLPPNFPPQPASTVYVIFLPHQWAHPVYGYPYAQPYAYRNPTTNQTQSVRVVCLCEEYSECGCDQNSNSTYYVSLFGGTTLPTNSSIVRVVKDRGTETIYINATLPNGTTAADPSISSATSMRLLHYSGSWILVALVGSAVWLL